MAFSPTDDFKSQWTQRTVMHAEGNALAYGLGNSSSQDQIQKNKDYRVADPSIKINEETRTRVASGTNKGGLSDYSAAAANGADESTMDWITVDATGSRAFRAYVDQRDIDYIDPVSLGLIRTRMGQAVTRWIDQHIWAQVIDNVAAANSTQATVTNVTGINHDNGKWKAGNAAQKTAAGLHIVDWIKDLNLKAAIANIDPGTGSDDVAIPVASMTAPVFQIIVDALLDKYDNTDLIVNRTLGTAPTFYGGAGRYKGTLFGIDIFSSNSKSNDDGTEGLFPRSTTSSNASQEFRTVACLPSRSWDNAIKQYGTKYDEPDARSAKGVFATELEGWVKVDRG